jgi:hypothetical protein
VNANGSVYVVPFVGGGHHIEESSEKSYFGFGFLSSNRGPKVLCETKQWLACVETFVVVGLASLLAI